MDIFNTFCVSPSHFPILATLYVRLESPRSCKHLIVDFFWWTSWVPVTKDFLQSRSETWTNPLLYTEENEHVLDSKSKWLSEAEIVPKKVSIPVSGFCYKESKLLLFVLPVYLALLKRKIWFFFFFFLIYSISLVSPLVKNRAVDRSHRQKKQQWTVLFFCCPIWIGIQQAIIFTFESFSSWDMHTLQISMSPWSWTYYLNLDGDMKEESEGQRAIWLWVSFQGQHQSPS